ncbi:Putative serine dehydratase domain-containing protein [Izhakiella capsodis]|uniref:Serine dehydratase domain-containing protein n=1 Tax=Izhakiella capsodis TaxID=1367852 RepID=A0A1I4X4B7_9GAMM|nr:Putative serine dehydratase domain-containing protein [Izhakiella capsodis]
MQSVPEPDSAIVNFGKRDSAFDAGLPQPVAHYRQGKTLPVPTSLVETVGMMDQYAMLKLKHGAQLQVGDMLLFSTSHPCLTFDKWQVLLLVDDDYNLLDELATAF